MILVFQIIFLACFLMYLEIIYLIHLLHHYSISLIIYFVVIQAFDQCFVKYFFNYLFQCLFIIFKYQFNLYVIFAKTFFIRYFDFFLFNYYFHFDKVNAQYLLLTKWLSLLFSIFLEQRNQMCFISAANITRCYLEDCWHFINLKLTLSFQNCKI